MKKNFKKRAMAMGMAAVMSVGSVSVLDTTAIQAAVKNLNKASATKSLVVGAGYKKKISLSNIPKNTKVTYTSKNKKVATVDKKGTVKGKKTGSTYITLKMTYKKKSVTKKCKVTVKSAVKSVKVAKNTITLNVGKTYQTKTTVSPAKAYQKVTYTSANKSIATVSAKGLVKAKKAGTTKITVKAQDGSGKSVKFTVKVKKVTKPTVKPTKTPVVTKTPETPTVTETATPTVAETTTPTTVPTTSPAETPATTPVATAGVTPTVAPPTAVPPTVVTKTITGADVKDGKVVVTGEYDNLIIESSVGNAEVTLDKTVVRNKLTMNGNADYTVLVKDAQIANAEVVEENPVVQVSVANISRFIKFALGKRPTLHVQGNTVITNIHVGADVQLVGENTGKVENVVIVKESNVAISAPVTSLKVEQTAKSASIMVASEVSKLDVVAPSAVISIAGAGKVNDVAVDKKAEGAVLNVSGQVKNIKAEAKTTTVKVEKEAKVEAIQVVKEAEGTKIELAGTVTNVLTEAKTTTLKVEKDAKVDAIKVVKEAEGTQIELAGTVNNVVAEAKTTTLKVEKEAKVEAINIGKEAEGTKLDLAGTVTNVTTAADKTEVTIAEEAKVNNLETSGNSTTIQGSGTVEKIEIKGNDTSLEGVGTDNLVVDKDASGTTVNDKDVSGGTQTEVKPIPKPGDNTGDNTGGNLGGNTGDNTGDNTGGSSDSGNSGSSDSGNSGSSDSGNSGSGSQNTQPPATKSPDEIEQEKLATAKNNLSTQIQDSTTYLSEVKNTYAATGSAVTGLENEIANANALWKSTTVTDASIVEKQNTDLVNATKVVESCINEIDSNSLKPSKNGEELLVYNKKNLFTVYTAYNASGSALKDIVTTELENYTVDIAKDDSEVIFTKTVDSDVVFKGTWNVVRYREVAANDAGEFNVKESLSDNISKIEVVNSDNKYIIVAVGKNGAVLQPTDILGSHNKANTEASEVHFDDIEEKWIQVDNTSNHTFKKYDYIIETDTIAPLESGTRTVGDKEYAVSVNGNEVTVGLPSDVKELPKENLNSIFGIPTDTSDNVSYETEVATTTGGAITITKKAYGKEIAKNTSYTFVTKKAGTKDIGTFNFSVGNAKDIYVAEVEDSAVAIYAKEGVTSCDGVVVSNAAISGKIEVLKYSAGSDNQTGTISISYNDDGECIQNLPVNWVRVPDKTALTVALKDNSNFEQLDDETNEYTIVLEAKNKDAKVSIASFDGKIDGTVNSNNTALDYDETGELTITYKTNKGTKIDKVSQTYTVDVRKFSELATNAFEFSKNADDVLAVEQTEEGKVVIYGTDTNGLEETDITVKVTSGSATETDGTNNKYDGIVKVTTTSDNKKVIKVTYGSGVETYVKTFEYEYVTVPSELAVELSDSEKDNFEYTISGNEITLKAKNKEAKVTESTFIVGTKGIDNKIQTDSHIKSKYDGGKLTVTYDTTNGTTLSTLTQVYNVNVKLFSDLQAEKFVFTGNNTNVLAMETKAGSDGNDTLVVYKQNIEAITNSDIQKVEVTSEGAVDMSVSATVSESTVEVTYGTNSETYVKKFTIQYEDVPNQESLYLGCKDSNTFEKIQIISEESVRLTAIVPNPTVNSESFVGKVKTGGSYIENKNLKVNYVPDQKKVTITYETEGGKTFESISKTFTVEVVQQSLLSADKFTFTKAETTGNGFLGVVRDGEKVLVYRNDDKEEVGETDITVKVVSGSATDTNGVDQEHDGTVEFVGWDENVVEVFYGTESEKYVKDFEVAFVQVPDQAGLELKLNDNAEGIIALKDGVLLTETEASKIAESFDVTGLDDGALENFTVVSSSAVTGNNNVAITVGLDVKGTTNTEPKNALVTFTKNYTVYTKATGNTNSTEIQLSSSGLTRIAKMSVDNETKVVKVYMKESNEIDSSDLLAAKGNEIKLSDDKKVYVLSDSGTYTEYELQSLKDVSSSDSSDIIALSVSDDSKTKVKIDDRIITYYKNSESANDVLQNDDLTGGQNATIQLVSGSGVNESDEKDVKEVGRVFVDNGTSYVVYTVNYVVVPEANTLDADFADGLSDKIVYKEKKDDGTFTILTTDAKAVTAGAFKPSTNATDKGNVDIAATYEKGTLTIGYYAKGDVENGVPKAGATPLRDAKKDCTVEVITENTEGAPEADTVELAVAEDSTNIVSVAAIKVDSEEEGANQNVVIVTLSAPIDGADYKIKAGDLTSDDYDIYVNADGKELYLVFKTEESNNYTKYSIVVEKETVEDGE